VLGVAPTGFLPVGFAFKRSAIIARMALTIDEVRHIAHLARLHLSPEEEARFAEQLSAILDYADRLQRVDTSTIPPTASVLPLTAPLREDQPRPSTPRSQILENAPEEEEGMFKVPPVLDK
jgi:aspartyl-tRNA(Asn)/glutamyl-tRNA(Gln) amidotransferase subunit C